MKPNSAKSQIHASSSKRASRARASTLEAKDDLRATLISAGRELLSVRGPGEISLRGIAAAAGYSPGTIYKYFDDHRAFLLAIREEDMLTAVIAFEKIAKSERDPEKRVIKVFRGAARYWLENFDHYQLLFSLSPNKVAVKDPTGLPFGKTPVVVRSYSLYDRIVRDVLAAYGAESIDAKCAVDSLIAAVHGVTSFPLYTRTMEWTAPLKMVDFIIEAVLASWKASASASIGRRGRSSQAAEPAMRDGRAKPARINV
jgi:AcrR family transcriptional regulator